MPVPKQQVHILSPITSVNMPEYALCLFPTCMSMSDQMSLRPDSASPAPQQDEEPEYRESTPAPMSFPLPALHEVIEARSVPFKKRPHSRIPHLFSRPVRDAPSSYTLGEMNRPTNPEYISPETE